MTRITISIDPDEYRAIEYLAQQDERSAAWVIRKAVRDFLEQQNVSSLGGTTKQNDE